MKLSKYAALVRREGLCCVFRVHNDGVWLGCKGAIYRAGELPEFSGREQTRAIILSLDDKQMDKVYLQEYDCERYYRYNKELLFEESSRSIEARLQEL